MLECEISVCELLEYFRYLQSLRSSVKKGIGYVQASEFQKCESLMLDFAENIIVFDKFLGWRV